METFTIFNRINGSYTQQQRWQDVRDSDCPIWTTKASTPAVYDKKLKPTCEQSFIVSTYLRIIVEWTQMWLLKCYIISCHIGGIYRVQHRVY